MVGRFPSTLLVVAFLALILVTETQGFSTLPKNCVVPSVVTSSRTSLLNQPVKTNAKACNEDGRRNWFRRVTATCIAPQTRRRVRRGLVTAAASMVFWARPGHRPATATAATIKAQNTVATSAKRIVLEDPSDFRQPQSSQIQPRKAKGAAKRLVLATGTGGVVFYITKKKNNTGTSLTDHNHVVVPHRPEDVEGELQQDLVVDESTGSSSTSNDVDSGESATYDQTENDDTNGDHFAPSNESTLAEEAPNDPSPIAVASRPVLDEAETSVPSEEEQSTSQTAPMSQGTVPHEDIIQVELSQVMSTTDKPEVLDQNQDLVQARQQPKPASQEAALGAKYAAIESLSERSYQILLDLGMLEESST